MLKFNDIEIKRVIFNSTELEDMYFNGIKIFERIIPNPIFSKKSDYRHIKKSLYPKNDSYQREDEKFTISNLKISNLVIGKKYIFKIVTSIFPTPYIYTFERIPPNNPYGWGEWKPINRYYNTVWEKVTEISSDGAEIDKESKTFIAKKNSHIFNFYYSTGCIYYGGNDKDGDYAYFFDQNVGFEVSECKYIKE